METKELAFVHRYVEGKSDQTLLLLHGTGGNEEDLLSIGEAVGGERNLLSPRGKVLEHGMPRFFRRLAEGVFDEEDVRRRAAELAEFVREASTAYGFDAGKVTALGYSNGANIAGAVMLLRPEVLAGAVLLRPMVPLVPAVLPKLAGKRVLISSGRFDPMGNAQETRRLREMFENAGAAVTMAEQAAGHNLVQEDFAQAKRWLETT